MRILIAIGMGSGFVIASSLLNWSNHNQWNLSVGFLGLWNLWNPVNLSRFARISESAVGELLHCLLFAGQICNPGLHRSSNCESCFDNMNILLSMYSSWRNLDRGDAWKSQRNKHMHHNESDHLNGLPRMLEEYRILHGLHAEYHCHVKCDT